VDEAIPGGTYAKRPINVYKAPKGTHASTETKRQEDNAPGNVDEMAELRKHAAEQAALFNLGADEADTTERSTGDHLGE
jgi:hypothetical protein